MGRPNEPSVPRGKWWAWMPETDVERRELSARAETDRQRTRAAAIVISFFISMLSWSETRRTVRPCDRSVGCRESTGTWIGGFNACKCSARSVFRLLSHRIRASRYRRRSGPRVRHAFRLSSARDGGGAPRATAAPRADRGQTDYG